MDRATEAPLYIVSKGRADVSLTSRALHAMGVAHYVVVEAGEVEAYKAAVPPSATVLTLDPEYQRDYDPCDDLGDSKSKGPGPARNFVWDHALDAGARWHWVMDDNITGFYRLNRNLRVPMTSGACFAVMETFADRYLNVAMAGPNYVMFAPRRNKLGAYVLNTRIYSCNLIRNDVPYRWRGRYNEDTDLSLRMLKDGWCTVLYNAFLQAKVRTQTIKGGNTAEFYAHEGTLPKSQMQVNLHPDVSQLVWKYGRWHHLVDYTPFQTRNRLMRRPGPPEAQGADEFGLVFERRTGGRWVPADG